MIFRLRGTFPVLIRGWESPPSHLALAGIYEDALIEQSLNRLKMLQWELNTHDLLRGFRLRDIPSPKMFGEQKRVQHICCQVEQKHQVEAQRSVLLVWWILKEP